MPIRVRRIARAAIDIIRLTFARERLGDAGGSVPAPARNSSRSFLAMLFAIEPLAQEAAAPARARSFRPGALFAIEPLPVDPVPPPEPPRARLSLRALLAPEPLPLDPVPPARPRRRGKLASLFAPESLDDP